MDLGNQIRRHRKEQGLSQEQFAERIFVSRQTVSNWETGRTYPDVQSLLLMSSVLGVSVDKLVKGDVDMLREEMMQDSKRMNRLGWLMCLGVVVAITEMILGLVWWEWDGVPTLLCGAAITGLALVPAFEIERLKKKYDILTMGEIAAFEKGEDVNRETPAGLRARNHPWRMMVLKVLLGALCGGLVGFVATYLIMAVK